MTDAVLHRPDIDPDRTCFTIALRRPRPDHQGNFHHQQTRIDLVGRIGTAVLNALLPARRDRTRPRVKKRAISSKYRAVGRDLDHRTHKTTIQIAVGLSRSRVRYTRGQRRPVPPCRRPRRESGGLRRPERRRLIRRRSGRTARRESRPADLRGPSARGDRLPPGHHRRPRTPHRRARRRPPDRGARPVRLDCRAPGARAGVSGHWAARWRHGGYGSARRSWSWGA